MQVVDFTFHQFKTLMFNHSYAASHIKAKDNLSCSINLLQITNKKPAVVTRGFYYLKLALGFFLLTLHVKETQAIKLMQTFDLVNMMLQNLFFNIAYQAAV